MREDDSETWMVIIDPEDGIRASRIIALSYRHHLPLRIKETCFGLLVESERGVVRGFLELLRAIYPSGLLLKRRGYSIGDTRVCTATFVGKSYLRRAAEQFKYGNLS